MKELTVIRTKPYNTRQIKKKLDDGFEVAMCNQVGNELEYILEKDCEKVKYVRRRKA